MNIFNKSKFTDISCNLLRPLHSERVYEISSEYGYGNIIKLTHLDEILADFKDQINPSDKHQLEFIEFSLHDFI